MTRSVDADHEVYNPVADGSSEVVPEDLEAGTFIAVADGVAAKAQGAALQPENVADADFGALDESTDDTGAMTYSDKVNVDDIDAAEHPMPYTGLIEIPRQPNSEEDPEPRRNIGKAALATDEAEFSLDPDEDEDFERPTLEGKPVPTDLVDAYRQSMTGKILEHEEIVERAKMVEAGKVADWILRINDIVDSPDADALLTFRQGYIEDRQGTMRLDNKRKADDADTNTVEPEEQLSTDGKPLSRAKLAELATTRNREAKRARATEEVDGLIALSLRYRAEAEPGKTELSDELRADLEEIVSGGTRARHEMIDSISRWTFRQSMKYVSKAARVGIKPIDVIQEGNIGAIRAVDKFDWKLGFRLSTYSDLWIKQSIDKAIAAQSEIRKPQHVQEKLSKIYRKEQELRALLQPGEELSEEMVADAMDMSADDLAEFRRWDQQSVSLDKKIGDGDADDATLGENFQDDADSLEDQVAELDRQLRLEEALEITLSSILKNERQEFMIRARFGLDDPDGEPRAFTDIAKECGCSAEWVKQNVNRGLEKIRGHEDLMGLLAGLR